MTNIEEKKEDFGIADDRRRAVGAMVIISEDVTELRPGIVPIPGSINHVWCFVPSATRGGKPFGASQGQRRYATKEARDAAVAEYFDGARKRALKEWARCEHGAIGKTCLACFKALVAARTAAR